MTLRDLLLRALSALRDAQQGLETPKPKDDKPHEVILEVVVMNAKQAEIFEKARWN